MPFNALNTPDYVSWSSSLYGLLNGSLTSISWGPCNLLKSELCFNRLVNYFLLTEAVATSGCHRQDSEVALLYIYIDFSVLERVICNSASLSEGIHYTFRLINWRDRYLSNVNGTLHLKHAQSISVFFALTTAVSWFPSAHCRKCLKVKKGGKPSLVTGRGGP